MELSRIEVIGTTPLPGLGVPLSHVPANVQVFSRGLRDRPASLPDFLDRNAASAQASSGQGNPFQPDFAYRGFTASPLLGLPQGVAVFQDGVRINEPFGDVVNWDLIPGSAIGSIQLIPGTVPVFGPNTLGGALAIYTKSGAQYPGGSLESYAGSYARRALQWEQGGSEGAWDYFFTGNLLRDAGWAEHNPSRIEQFFGKVGYQTDRTDLDLSVTVADNRLEGNQALPRSFLDDIRQPYTWPDRNFNRAALVALKGSRFLAEGILLGATAYARKYRNENLSSNVDADFAASGIEATNDRALIDQWGYGLGVQLTLAAKAAGRDNQFVLGASADLGDSRFMRFSQPAAFTPSRGTTGRGDFSATTDAATSSGHYGAFLSDTFSASEHWVFTLSARHDLARVGIDDRSGREPLLEGHHRFSRLNPAIGANFIPSPGLTAYMGFNEGMRAPTPIELTCADPSAPCKLPNNFLADPPLRPVVARTLEAGARGKWGDSGTWSAAAFRTALVNDIQFVSGGEGALNAGYFRNVGATRRQGIELAAASKRGPWEAAMRYSLVSATFRAPFLESSPNNSSADAAGNILVSPGNRIPGIPLRSLKVRLEFDPGDAWALGISVRCASAVVARGDEDNRDVNGTIPGFAVVDLRGRWRLAPDTEVFAFVDNLLDKRYAGAGLLGRNFFTGPAHRFARDDASAEQFRGMGSPLGAWIGIRYRWR